MTSFDFLWQLVETHGSVAEFYKAELARVWDEYTLDQQRFIYRSLRDKLRTGKFVNYNPVKAVRENAPKRKPQQVLSFNDYYNQYGTTEEREGWKRQFLPEKQTTIYVKRIEN